MTTFFKPYEGTRPFLFISYAHRQSEAVVDTIRVLHDRGYRLWYDEGIPAGSDWPANIAQHMQHCERVIYFLSARALESPNCFSEIRTAARLGKPVLIVRLEDVPWGGEWDELLAGKPEIQPIDGAADRAEAILRSGFVTRRFVRKWTEHIPWRGLGLAASLLFFLAAAGALGVLASGRWAPVAPPEVAVETPSPSPAPTAPPVIDTGGAERFFAVSFPDPQQETAVRLALDHPEGEIQSWDLAGIGSLYFCGNLVTDSTENVRFDADGVCRVNGAPVITGQVSDLRLLGSAVRLEELALICQPLDDLTPLSGHRLLRELSFAGSPVDDLAPLDDLPGLEILHLEHTPIRDLGSLDRFPALKTVTVSRDMLPLTWPESAGYSIVLMNEN